MYLLSDNVDTLRGMRLAGIEGRVVHEHDELKAALAEVMSDRKLGILLVTEKLSADFPDLIRQAKVRGKTPLVVGIPDRHGGSNTSEAIARYVKEAVGLSI